MPQTSSNADLPEDLDITWMVIWPSIARFRLGRLIGQLAGLSWGLGGFFTLGKLLALLTIPLSLVLYFWRLAPYVCRRYRLTTQRVAVLRGLVPVEERSIRFDQFDAVEYRYLPGQEWLRAGEVVFLRDGAEVFRLSGVPHPVPFVHVCRKARATLLATEEILRRQQARGQGA